MSTERDELVQIISRNLPRMERNFYDGTAEDSADAILAAGYRRPREVTTAAELDALPECSVVMHVYSDGSTAAWVKEGKMWNGCGWEDADDSVELLLEDDASTFATVLYEPEVER